MKKEVSELDKTILKKIRTNVEKIIESAIYDFDEKSNLILDIAPQIYEGAKSKFKHAEVQTLDISPDYSPDFVADICNNNSRQIPSDFFDAIICTEVLEHTLQPFSATQEIYRILKKGGKVYGSTPFNFRIHGPLPDCWRFTEHGLRSLFSQFSNIVVTPLEDSNRFLMPFHYTFVATK